MLQFILSNIKTPNDLHLYTLAKRNNHACKLVYRHFRKNLAKASDLFHIENPAKASEIQANFWEKFHGKHCEKIANIF